MNWGVGPEERIPDGVVPGSSPCDHLGPEDWRGQIFSRGRDLVAGGSAQARGSLANQLRNGLQTTLLSHRHACRLDTARTTHFLHSR